ncbi:hypothetical protein V6U71_11095 [Sphingopyxis sp. J-6]|uniref:hypothetical protein n=1 Tax=Sphingopyxis sp. J-6 TaxID=3122054 RepID=UPI0039844E5A
MWADTSEFMLSAILAILLSTQTTASPQLIDIEGLSTEKAGDLVLAGFEHRPIIAISQQKIFGPPGMVELKLAESPERRGSGCERRVWTTSFLLPIEGRIGTGRMQPPYASREVALSSNLPCELAIYSELSAELSVERGVELVAALKSFALEATAVRFRCSDSTRSGLCRDDERIRAALRDLRAWHVKENSGEAVMWLGEPQQTVTEVRFIFPDPQVVKINRFVPAPP